MSRFLKPNSQQAFAVHRENDQRVAYNDYKRPSDFIQDKVPYFHLWTKSGFSQTGNWFIGDSTGSLPESEWFNNVGDEASGATSHYSIVGFTKDSSGVAMPYVTVEGYTQADDIKQGECISWIDGSYTLPTQKNTAHYLRAYKVGGSANYGGTTDQTLIPS